MRHLCHNWGFDQRGFTGGWAFGLSPLDNDFLPRLRKVLGASDTDLVIPGAHSGDPIIKDPVLWVNTQIKKYLDSDKS